MQNMFERLEKVKEEANSEINSISDLKVLEDFRLKFLGKKGELSLLLKEMRDLEGEEKANFGKLANELRSQLEESITDLKDTISNKELLKKFEEQRIDVTIPTTPNFMAKIHPLTRVERELEEIFMSMGFSVVEGPEIETVFNNFDALNSPKDHPSRDITDTFYITDDLLLRTQTSPVQIRTMMKNEPPIKIISPGRCFRSDTPDATHSPMFNQLEGLVVDKNISFANFKFTLEIFLKRFFGDDTVVKFRPHNFPFTEPSAEVDISCFKCRGTGCPTCKGEGFIEILGAGMVHPNVLRNCGIDPEVYSGFAFGAGIERIAMMKYEIDDIRYLYENDMRFLAQF